MTQGSILENETSNHFFLIVYVSQFIQPFREETDTLLVPSVHL